MNLFRPITQVSLALAVGAMSGALHAESPGLVGQWGFQTATGTTTTNGVAVDLIDKGLLEVTED